MTEKRQTICRRLLHFGVAGLAVVVSVSSLAGAVAQSATLTWGASPTVGVVGYRVYYGTASSNYSASTALIPALTTTVTLPHSGRWFFAATAVDQSGVESSFSNEVQTYVKPSAPTVISEKWVILTPRLSRSYELVKWNDFDGEAIWIPATNASEFYSTRGLGIELVQRIK